MSFQKNGFPLWCQQLSTVMEQPFSSLWSLNLCQIFHSLCKSFNSFSFPTGYYNPNFFLQVDEQKGQLRRMKHTASYIREGENTQYCCNSEAILCSAAHVCQVWQITLKPGINLYSLNTTFPPLLRAEFQRISSREATRALSSFKHSHQITAKHEGLCKVPNKEGSNS